MPSNKKAVEKSDFHLEAELDKNVEVVFFSLHNLNFQQSGFSTMCDVIIAMYSISAS